MNKIIISIIAFGALIGSSVPSYASSWDKVGKALTVTEGVRVITGGKVDILGNLTGISRGSDRPRYNENRRYAYRNRCSRPERQRIWVPNYVWKRQYVPEQEEYSEEYGKIIVEGHYIRYQVEDSGHWE